MTNKKSRILEKSGGRILNIAIVISLLLGSLSFLGNATGASEHLNIGRDVDFENTASDLQNDTQPMYLGRSVIRGYVNYTNRDKNGNLDLVPLEERSKDLRFAKVDIYRFDLPNIETYVGTTYADEYGLFYYEFVPYPPEITNQYFVRACSENKYATVKDGDAYTTDSDIKPVPKDTTVYMTFSSYLDHPAWNILDSVTEAAEFVKAKTGGWTRSKIDINYPKESSEFKPFLNGWINLAASDGWEDYTTCHEYGHAIMYSKYLDSVPDYSVPHAFNREHTLQNTVSEGWAEFVEQTVGNGSDKGGWDVTYTKSRFPIEYGRDNPTAGPTSPNSIPVGDSIGEAFPFGDAVRSAVSSDDDENGYPDYDNNGNGIVDYNIIEGNFAGILWDIYDDEYTYDYWYPSRNNSPYDDDDLALGFGPIWDVMANKKPFTIYEFLDGWFDSTIDTTYDQRVTWHNIHWIKAICYNHGIKMEWSPTGYISYLPENSPTITDFQITSTPPNEYYDSYSWIDCRACIDEPDYEDFEYTTMHLEYLNGVNWVQFQNVSIDNMPIDYEGYHNFSFRSTSLPNGEWKIRATVDDDMMLATAPEQPTIKIDLTKPVSAVTGPTAYWRNTSSLIINATASGDPSGVNNMKLYYRFKETNATAWPNTWVFFSTTSASPWSWSFIWPKGEGHYQFYSIATDNAGNIEVAPVTADAEFGYDKTAPPAPSLVSPKNDASSTNHFPTFDWNSSADSLSGIRYYKFQVDDVSSFSTTLINIQIPSTITQYVMTSVLCDGLWYWRVLPVDNVGNEGPSLVWSIDIWTLPPPPQTGNVGGIARTSTGAPLAGVTITAVGASPAVKPGVGETIFNSNEENAVNTVTTASGTDGTWSMSIASCTATFTATKSGYYSDTAVTPVPSGGWTTVYLSLTAISTDPVYDTGDDGGGCLLSGAQISTQEGSVKIENINEGDLVLSFDEWTGMIEPRMVYQTIVHTNFEGYLVVNNRLMITTNHLIYTERGLVAAGNLIVGDVMLTLSGVETVTSIEIVPELATVYNFDVEDNHNYFADGILVHNVETLKDGCPFLYVWNGSHYIEENNILPQSTKPDRNQLDVDDYYMFQNEVAPINGSYSVQLYEPALERTLLDSVRLAIIDYDDADAMPMFTPDGTLVSISDLQAATSCIDSTGSEVQELVDEMNDGYTLKAEHNETLTVYFPVTPDFNEAKLVISHKAIIDILPYDVPIDPRYYKCSIHVQTMGGDGEWYDIASIPARMNKALDAVDITQLMDRIRNGQPLRLLITGTHIIDFIGIDFSDSADFSIEYVLPSYASYYNCTLTQNLTELLVQKDQRYAILNPKECIEILFPYIEQSTEHRALAFISNGHYNTLSEIDIEQSVAIKATIKSGTEGIVSLFVCEMINLDNSQDMVGITAHVSDWPNNETVLGFIQNPREEYRLSARFDGCTVETVIEVEIISARGSRICTMRYSPEMGSSAKIDCQLKDILWNVTGVSFNEYSNHYSVLKGTPLQFDINDWYGYDTQSWNGYTWYFGDGASSEDLRPMHEYDAPGTYLMNLTVQNAGAGMLFYAETRIDVVLSPPTPAIEIYQKISLDLTVAGRKDNSVGVRIYEDGLLIQSYDVVRSAGLPDSMTIGLKIYPDRNYEVEIVYNAEHKGSNPTWLNFTFGETSSTFFKEFNTKCGFCQTISVPTSYLVDVVANDFKYCFDASGSYDIDGEILSYEWDFGDGSASEDMFVEHLFIEPGLYTIILTITDDDGAITREICEVEVI